MLRTCTCEFFFGITNNLPGLLAPRGAPAPLPAALQPGGEQTGGACAPAREQTAARPAACGFVGAPVGGQSPLPQTNNNFFI